MDDLGIQADDGAERVGQTGGWSDAVESSAGSDQVVVEERVEEGSRGGGKGGGGHGKTSAQSVEAGALLGVGGMVGCVGTGEVAHDESDVERSKVVGKVREV